MARVSLDSIAVLENLLREIGLVHEQLQATRDETCRRQELKMEEVTSSFREAGSQLEQAVANESHLVDEISSTTDRIESLQHTIDSLESQL